MTIQQLSREVGIGVDTLRVWERRYGFPLPGRDRLGHRSYGPDQVEALRLVKALQMLGQRPGIILALEPSGRRELLDRLLARPAAPVPELELLLQEEPLQLGRWLQARLASLGPAGFAQEVAVPLLGLLDRGWSAGTLSVAREHLISDQLERILVRQLAGQMPQQRPQTLLFLTLNGERHRLGLLLAAAMFHQQGFGCLVLGEPLPLSEVPPLAAQLGVAAVAVSFSRHYPSREAKQDSARLRRMLPAHLPLLVGGAAVQGEVSRQGLSICGDLQEIPTLVRRLFPH